MCARGRAPCLAIAGGIAADRWLLAGPRSRPHRRAHARGSCCMLFFFLLCRFKVYCASLACAGAIADLRVGHGVDKVCWSGPHDTRTFLNDEGWPRAREMRDPGCG
jgi:hypothetical protein